MEKKLIVRIAEGLGNQLFMYANAYSLSKKIKYELLVDDKSGFIKTKNFRSYYLHNFNISAKIIDTIILSIIVDLKHPWQRSNQYQQ